MICPGRNIEPNHDGSRQRSNYWRGLHFGSLGSPGRNAEWDKIASRFHCEMVSILHSVRDVYDFVIFLLSY